MKTKITVPCLFLLLVLSGCRTGDQITYIDYSELRYPGKHRVVGQLGIPICTYVKIRATVVDPGFEKGHVGYYLDVLRVGERDLAAPLRMEFFASPFLEGLPMPREYFERYQQLYGQKVGTLSSQQIDEIGEDYVGRTYDLVVYETGRFREPPSDTDAEWGIPPIQMRGYDFETWLVIERSIEQKSNKSVDHYGSPAADGG